MNGIPADVFNHHIMPAACENQTLRAELTRVRNQLDSKTSLVDYLRCELMMKMCELGDKLCYSDIYGNGEIEEEWNKPTRGIDDFRLNLISSSTFNRFRVLKLVDSSVPNKEQLIKILNFWGIKFKEYRPEQIQILTAEERDAELIPMHNGEDFKQEAFKRPRLIYCMEFMYVE